MVIVENTMVDMKHGHVILKQFSIDDDKYIPAWTKVAEAIHRHDAHAAIQLGDFGRKSRLNITKLVTSSRSSGHEGIYGYALTTAEIKVAVGNFAKAAARAQQAGFDAVEIHGTHGYLINQFLSAAMNTRDDEYGGSLENRVRFLIEIIAAVKAALGADYPVLVRLTAAEPDLPSGLTVEETAQMAALCEKAGTDAIDISDADDSKTDFLPNAVLLPHGHALKYSRVVKQAVTVPVLVAGKIDSRELAEKAVREGMADIVSVGRAMIADPELPRKWTQGGTEPTRPCVRCTRCIDTIADKEIEIECTVNPAAGRERDFMFRPTGEPKRVLVVGGGPAGMEAACMLARRGHKVALWEKANVLGGMLLAAVVPPRKEPLAKLTDYLVREVERLPIELKLGLEASTDTIVSAAPDVVIVATGSEPLVPNIPGIDAVDSIKAVDLLLGAGKVGERTVVIGAGRVGCETAEYLVDRGKKVTLVCRSPRMGNTMLFRERLIALEMLRTKGVVMMSGVQYREFASNALIVSRQGETCLLEMDTAVIAAGGTPRQDLYFSLRERGIAAYPIGDSSKLGAIRDSLSAAQQLALGL